MIPVTIDCTNSEWKPFLKHSLQDGLDVVLNNFDYTVDGQFCELLALTHAVVFSIDFKRRSGFFKKKSALSGELP